MNNEVIVEIRAAEGGTDAKLLVKDQYHVYKSFTDREGL